jgi:heterodisulfide reductase subunit C
MAQSFQLSLAPEQLWQAINPLTFYQQGAQFGVVNFNLGQTPKPELEQRILDQVGSYGRQLGRIGDALEVIVKHVKLDALNATEQDALTVLLGQLAAIRQIKQEAAEDDRA